MTEEVLQDEHNEEGLEVTELAALPANIVVPQCITFLPIFSLLGSLVIATDSMIQ